MIQRPIKVLLIGHNVLDERTAFGKTLASFFKTWGAENLAELYFHSEVPTTDICGRYYRITDTDALKSVFTLNRKKVGRSFTFEQIDRNRPSSRTDTGVKKRIYSFARRRTSYIYIARNSIWSMSKWYCEELRNWLRDFAPDVIFFVAGDYGFAYKVAYRISKDLNIPIVTYSGDDYYVNRLNPHSLLSRPVYNALMKNVRKCVSRAACMITICPQMARAYEKLFDKPIYTVYTGYSIKNDAKVDGKGIVYLGNLGYSRYKSLVDIGRALKEINAEQYHLDVYSTESREEILRELTPENGIVFHGAVSSNEVNNIISNSMLVVHAEDFSSENIDKIRYSISTKVADLLASGRCILAYGPKEVASIDYLLNNQAACVVHDKAQLKDTLEDILSSPQRRMQIVASAKALSEQNHSESAVAKKVAEIIATACEGDL